MGVSAKFFAILLMVLAASAVPTGDHERRTLLHKDETLDLSAESSEVSPKAIVAPTITKDIHVNEARVAAAGNTEHSIELVGDSQTFFPSFANLFEPRQTNNYKLSFNQEGAFSQRPNSYRSLLNYPLFGSYRSIDGFSKQNSAASAPLVDSNSGVLGSGNFGILRGGTFLAQEDDESDYNDGYSSFYNNGHGRPSLGLGYIANPRPNYSQDQFANFRDFADINTPSNSAYSHFVVVYANKNATTDEISEESKRVTSEPKNIFETLELLDNAKIPLKISKSKSKLEKTKEKMLKKKEQWTKPKSKKMGHELDEPLLALS